MRQRWWIAIVAVVGIGLAIVLFPRPDTGDAIPDEPEAEARSVGAEPAASPSGRKRSDADPNVRGRTDPRPGMEAIVARRNQPEAVYAGKLVTPFSSIRYALVKEQTEPAKALADEIGVLMNDLRDMRVSPDEAGWPALQEKTDAMIAKVKASEWAENEQIERSFQKYDDFLAEYQTAKAAGEAAGGAPGVPGVPGVPPGAIPGTPGTPPGTPANPTPAPVEGEEGH